jgi:hypothetical protein
MSRGIPRDELLDRYNELWDRHKGNLHLAAPLLGMTKAALERALYRARAAGVEVRMSGVRY